MTVGPQKPSYARELAYTALGVRESDIPVRISPQLAQIWRSLRRRGTAMADGTKFPASAYYYLNASADPDARKVLVAYYALPRTHRRQLPIEAFCMKAGVSPLHVLEVIVATCVRIGAQASTIIAATSHPRVVEKTVEMALTDDGVEDRAMLHKATGFTPSPKGAQTTINVQASASAAAAARTMELPPAEQTIREMVDTFNEARPALPAATRVPDATAPPVRDAVPIDAEFEDADTDDDDADADDVSSDA